MVFLLLAAAAVSSSAAPAVPDAPIAVVERVPERHNFNRWDYALYAGVVAYRAGDYYTTERAHSIGAKEYELPEAFVSSRGGFAAYSFGMAAIEITTSVYLHKRHHAKLARFADAVSIGAGAGTVANNVRWIRKYNAVGHW